MAFQFVHAKTYSIKSGGAGIAAEAGRKPDHSRHVDDPKPPVLLAGVEPEDAWSEIERRHGEARATVTMKNGKQAQRKLRKDENVLLAAVASYPVPTEKLDPEDPAFQDWKRRALKFFEKHHGQPLSAVLHLDESHPHIHFLTAPDLEAGERMADIHPGERAKRDAGGRTGKRVEKNNAYKTAMRGYQDDFYSSVSQYHGHARLGPQRQRLSRAEWKAQEAQEQHFAKQAEKILKAKKGLAESRQNVETRLKSVSKAERQVERSTANLKKQENTVEKLKSELNRRQQQISDRERRMAGVWGVLVSFVTLGRAGTKKRIQEAQKAAKDDAAKQIAKAEEKSRKAARVLQKRVDKAIQERDVFERQKGALENKLIEAQGAHRAAETSRDEMKRTYQPMQAENATLSKDLRLTRAFISDLEKAAEKGDIDQLLERLKKDPEPSPLNEILNEHGRNSGITPNLG